MPTLISDSVVIFSFNVDKLKLKLIYIPSFSVSPLRSYKTSIINLTPVDNDADGVIIRNSGLAGKVTNFVVPIDGLYPK